MDLSQIFKAYDIRGVYPGEINEAAVKRIAGAYVAFLKQHPEQGRRAALPQGQGGNSEQGLRIAIGRDVRLSSPSLQKAVVDGLTAAGVNVIDIGPVPTEMLYFAVGFYHFDGGIQVSASHNPTEFNGLKMVRSGVEAISSDNGLLEIKKLAESDQNFAAETEGSFESKEIEEDYFDFLTKFVHFDSIKPLKIVANNNFGLSGPLAKRLLARLNNSHLQLLELNFEPDGHFPKGRPDPSLTANRAETTAKICQEGADMGVSWDADGDRCYISDEQGEVIQGCHLTALLAVHLLKEHPSQKILHDPRNIWAVEKSVKAAGGVPLINKAGHTFIKNRMRQEDALFAGETSGHFYFRDFYFADNGLIPFLLVLNIVSAAKKPVSEIIKPLRDEYFVSDEINFEVADKAGALKKVEDKYADGQVDRTDGLSVTFDSWRFNLRASNTENLLRLNVEAKDRATCDQKTQELSALIG